MTAALAVGAALCFAAAALILIAVDLRPTGYRPVRDAVSDYGVGAQRAYYRALVTLMGVGAALLLGALAHRGGVASAGLGWLGVYAAARLAIAWFPTDLPGAAPTAAGRIHVLLARRRSPPSRCAPRGSATPSAPPARWPTR